MYGMEELAETFQKHAIEAERENSRILKEFKEEYPNEPVPEWAEKDFCLSTALAAMCREISELKMKTSHLCELKKQ